jgi:hypothetical protein
VHVFFVLKLKNSINRVAKSVDPVYNTHGGELEFRNMPPKRATKGAPPTQFSGLNDKEFLKLWANAGNALKPVTTANRRTMENQLVKKLAAPSKSRARTPPPPARTPYGSGSSAGPLKPKFLPQPSAPSAPSLLESLGLKTMNQNKLFDLPPNPSAPPGYYAQPPPPAYEDVGYQQPLWFDGTTDDVFVQLLQRYGVNTTELETTYDLRQAVMQQYHKDPRDAVWDVWKPKMGIGANGRQQQYDQSRFDVVDGEQALYMAASATRRARYVQARNTVISRSRSSAHSDAAIMANWNKLDTLVSDMGGKGRSGIIPKATASETLRKNVEIAEQKKEVVELNEKAAKPKSDGITKQAEVFTWDDADADLGKFTPLFDAAKQLCSPNVEPVKVDASWLGAGGKYVCVVDSGESGYLNNAPFNLSAKKGNMLNAELTGALNKSGKGLFYRHPQFTYWHEMPEGWGPTTMLGSTSYSIKGQPRAHVANGSRTIVTTSTSGSGFDNTNAIPVLPRNVRVSRSYAFPGAAGDASQPVVCSSDGALVYVPAGNEMPFTAEKATENMYFCRMADPESFAGTDDEGGKFAGNDPFAKYPAGPDEGGGVPLSFVAKLTDSNGEIVTQHKYYAMPSGWSLSDPLHMQEDLSKLVTWAELEDGKAYLAQRAFIDNRSSYRYGKIAEGRQQEQLDKMFKVSTTIPGTTEPYLFACIPEGSKGYNMNKSRVSLTNGCNVGGHPWNSNAALTAMGSGAGQYVTGTIIDPSTAAT